MTFGRTGLRPEPESLELPVRPGVPASPRPPVRIFLGTEPRQHRAERVFVWSIERVRDPARVYRIFLMRDLAGFRRLWWTTGFTNYRFAIPHLAGGAGRALYNDADQIYLSDPAELFDLELGEHGYRAVAADDTSVMLLDCARMADVWPLRDAQRLHKRRLVSRAARTPGLYGGLAPEWNARDDEYEEGRSKVLHFTTLHTQPWRPFPERFVYQEHAQGELWAGLERSADEAGFQLFTRERPSARYRERFGSGESPPPRDRLEEVPEEDLPWVLDALSDPDSLRVRCVRPRRSLRGLGAPVAERHTPAWWRERFEAAARRHPRRSWEVALESAGRQERLALGPRRDERPPRVWVLVGADAGCAGEGAALAAELGWPSELRTLAERPALEPPWPDLVIAAGRGAAAAALRIRRRSEGGTRLVQIGGGGDPEAFDLSVTPGYAEALPHPRRIATHGPLVRFDDAALAEAADRFKERLGVLRSPRIGVLVGGSSDQFAFGAETAARLGRDVSRMAEASGGSILATTSHRTSREEADAFCAALAGQAFVYRWRPRDPDDPWTGLLALVDVFVATGDSEHLLAAAAALERPLYVYPLAERRAFRIGTGLRRFVAARARAAPAGPRGTPRPQTGLEYLCARLLERGFVEAPRDLGALHEDLYRRGVARLFDRDADASAPWTAPRMLARQRDLERVAERVRTLLGTSGTGGSPGGGRG